jgi:hypothetical protein
MNRFDAFFGQQSPFSVNQPLKMEGEGCDGCFGYLRCPHELDKWLNQRRF